MFSITILDVVIITKNLYQSSNPLSQTLHRAHPVIVAGGESREDDARALLHPGRACSPPGDIRVTDRGAGGTFMKRINVRLRDLSIQLAGSHRDRKNLACNSRAIYFRFVSSSFARTRDKRGTDRHRTTRRNAHFAR